MSHMIKSMYLAIAALLLMGMQSIYLQTYTTSYFRIRYEKSVSSKDVTKFGALLETAHAKFKKKFGMTLTGRVDVMYYSSPERMKHETKIPLFDDGMFRGGRIYVAAGRPPDAPQMQGMVSRIAARCVLNEIKGCPFWLAECYSIFAGNEVERYGRPSRPTMLSFADLAEDFSRAERADEYKEVYAKLAVTASFFVNRYGETKFESVFAQMKSGKSLEVALESAFGEKISVIEKSWSKAIAASQK